VRSFQSASSAHHIANFLKIDFIQLSGDWWGPPPTMDIALSGQRINGI